jgi:hypothetical protein
MSDPSFQMIHGETKLYFNIRFVAVVVMTEDYASKEGADDKINKLDPSAHLKVKKFLHTF